MRQLIMTAMIFVSLLAASESLRADPAGEAVLGVPAGAAFQLSADKPSYFLGENVLLHYEVKNTGTKPFRVSSGGRLQDGRRLSLTVVATDQAGQLLLDPSPPGPVFAGNGPVWSRAVDPGDSYIESVPVMRYRLFEKPGKYTVRIMHDCGWDWVPDKDGNIPDDDKRWTSIQIELVMPTAAQAEQMVAAMRKMRDPTGKPGEKSEPYADFSCLRDPIYLPAIQRLIDEGDPRGLEALSEVATPEATRAIVKSLASKDAKIAQAAVVALRERMPLPATRMRFSGEGQNQRRTEMVKHSWRDEFVEPVMVYARQTLRSNPRNGLRDPEMEEAALLIDAIATPAEMPTVIGALDRLLEISGHVPLESPLIYGVIPMLQMAANALLTRGAKPPEKPESPGEIAVYLESAKRGKPPAGFEELAHKWIDHPIPYVQRLTLEALPTPPPSWAAEVLRKKLESPDVGVQLAATNVVIKLKDASFGEAMLKLVRRSRDQWVVSAAGEGAKASGVERDKVLLAWTDHFDQADAREVLLTVYELMSVFEHAGAGGNTHEQPSAELRASLKAHWIALIEGNRDAIRAGKKFKPTGPEFSRDLFPPGCSMGYQGKQYPPP